MESGCQIGGSTGRGSLGRANTGSLSGNRGSLASVGKPTSSTLASLAGLLSNNDIKMETKSETSFSNKLEKEEVFQRVRVSVVCSRFCIKSYKLSKNFESRSHSYQSD